MVFLAEKYLNWVLAGYVALTNLLLQSILFSKCSLLDFINFQH